MLPSFLYSFDFLFLRASVLNIDLTCEAYMARFVLASAAS